MNKLLLLSVVLGCLLFGECDSSPSKQEDKDDDELDYVPVQDAKLVRNCRQQGEVAGRATNMRCENSCLDYTESRRTPRYCYFIPRERCFCLKGQVRLSDDYGEKCVQVEQCPGMRPRF